MSENDFTILQSFIDLPFQDRWGSVENEADSALERIQAQLRRFAEDVPGAFYSGVQKANGYHWHVVSVNSPEGRRQGVLTRTRDQADAIVALSEYGASLIREEA